MTRKPARVRHDEGAGGAEGRAADALARADRLTGGFPLERPQQEEVGGRGEGVETWLYRCMYIRLCF